LKVFVKLVVSLAKTLKGYFYYDSEVPIGFGKTPTFKPENILKNTKATF
jgi:hypothetical protein